jgi:glutaconate CoA-transferase subunit B
VLKFEDETHEMYLAERYEGVTPEQVQQNTGFALDCTRSTVTVPPTAEELRILRDDVDPQRLILG